MFIRRYLIIVVAFLFLIWPISCEKIEEIFVDCNECITYYPPVADVTIRFTINKDNSFVKFKLYRGNLECEDFILDGITYGPEWDLRLDVNQYYTIVAEYISDNRIIYVVDGTDLRVKFDKSSCDQDCYFVFGDELDARLKY